MSRDAADIAIVGGGLVGASLAAALARPDRKIALIESAAPPSGEPSWDERCIALNAASRSIFESIGAWDAIERFAEPIVWTHISERGKFGVARFTAQEAGLPALGYNVPVRAIGEALWQGLKKTQGVELIAPARVAEVRNESDSVAIGIEGGKRTLRAKLVVAADGAQSAVRTLLGIDARTHDYEQRAIVTAVRTTRPHRGCAYERFTPDGPIALLPKPDGCSLVWTVPADRADAMLAWSDEEFLREAQRAFGERLGRFIALGKRVAFPLSQVMSEQLTAPRVIFAGNAAQSLHPVAAQGFNLGLRDVATIAELVADAADPGASALLAEYERRRSRDRDTISSFTDRLVRLFSNRIPALRGLRHLGLLALDVLPPVKEAVMYQNLGFGSLPAALHDR
ncbi:MAG TPA: 2-octaprenyl-6-methoxyphenyl hydroxylase [Nevskiaceae bacterium]|nr:2-octaprenyl-6-methoxyphenyl hydroxylase [Nevskiaceae bacterium]